MDFPCLFGIFDIARVRDKYNSLLVVFETLGILSINLTFLMYRRYICNSNKNKERHMFGGDQVQQRCF